MIERQEIHCHACNRWVQFEIDLELDGNHVLNCPNCDHEHCRVVKKGQITDIRWDQRNGPTHSIQYASYSIQATYITSSVNTYYPQMMNATSGGGGNSITSSYMMSLWQSAGTGS